MAARASKKKGTGSTRARSQRTRPSVLGNDPFERGAAARTPAPAPGPEAASTPALAPAASAPPPPPPAPAVTGERPEAVAASPEPSAAALPAVTGEPIGVPIEAAGESAPEVVTAPPNAEARVPAPAPEVGPAPGAAVTGSAVAGFRTRLDSLEAAVESATSAASSAAARLADLARREATGEQAQELCRTLLGLLPALRERLSGLATLRTLFTGPGELDFYGMDHDLVERAAPVLEFLYASWWRVEARDVENVPDEGPVVVVANHGGALPWDALVLRTALRRDHPAHRDLRPLLDERTLKVPVAGATAARLGAVPATPDHALRLLGEGRAIAVFPEATHGGPRPWPERYQVQQLGRGGFAKLAMRAGATIVPCAVVGSEETSAPFSRPGWLSERLRLPLLLTVPPLPVSALGLFPLPARWSLRFGAPIAVPHAPPPAEESALASELAERVRSALQRMLDEDVAARRSVYL